MLKKKKILLLEEEQKDKNAVEAEANEVHTKEKRSPLGFLKRSKSEPKKELENQEKAKETDEEFLAKKKKAKQMGNYVVIGLFVLMLLGIQVLSVSQEGEQAQINPTENYEAANTSADSILPEYERMAHVASYGTSSVPEEPKGDKDNVSTDIVSQERAEAIIASYQAKETRAPSPGETSPAIQEAAPRKVVDDTLYCERNEGVEDSDMIINLFDKTSDGTFDFDESYQTMAPFKKLALKEGEKGEVPGVATLSFFYPVANRKYVAKEHIALYYHCKAAADNE